MITGSLLVFSRALSRRQISRAGDARQHPVEHDKVWWVLGQAQFRLVAPLDAFNNITLRLEIVGEQEREVRVVLDDEDARLRARTGDILTRLVHTFK